MVVMGLLLDILVLIHHPLLRGFLGWCYVSSLLWPEQLPASEWGAVLGRGIKISPGKTSGMSYGSYFVYSRPPLITAG